MDEMAQELLNENGFDDWEVVDDCVIICPHGDQIEWDGMCPKGCVSPLMEMGLV